MLSLITSQTPRAPKSGDDVLKKKPGCSISRTVLSRGCLGPPGKIISCSNDLPGSLMPSRRIDGANQIHSPFIKRLARTGCKEVKTLEELAKVRDLLR